MVFILPRVSSLGSMSLSVCLSLALALSLAGRPKAPGSWWRRSRAPAAGRSSEICPTRRVKILPCACPWPVPLTLAEGRSWRLTMHIHLTRQERGESFSVGCPVIRTGRWWAHGKSRSEKDMGDTAEHLGEALRLRAIATSRAPEPTMQIRMFAAPTLVL